MKPQLILFLAALTPLCGCGQASTSDSGASAAKAVAATGGYVPPPEMQGLAPGPAGGVTLSGQAAPGARVRLATPQGAAQMAQADADGHWRLTVPAFGQARLFGLSMFDHDRQIQAQGYLLLTPDGLAVRLRAGGGAEVVGPSPPRPSLETVDVDSQGAATVAGRASPGDALTLRVDGLQRGQAVARADGRYVVTLNQPLPAGAHEFDLTGANGETRLTLPISPQAQVAGVFTADRTGFGWVAHWLAPGGGVQTTLVNRTAGSAS